MAGDLTNAIVDSIDQRKQKKTNLFLDIFLTVLSLGLYFIPYIGPIAGASTTAIAAANGAVQVLKEAPNVAKSVLPAKEGTPPQQIAANSLAVQNSMATQFVRARLEEGLALVQGVNQSSVAAFLEFAGSGAFSTGQQSSPLPDFTATANSQPGQVPAVLLAYTTYIATTTLAQTGWHAIMLPGINPQALTNGSVTVYPSWAGDPDNNADLNCDGYDDYGQCNGTYWWYSQAQNSAYVLNQGKDEDSAERLRTILSAGWSTGQLLFENAAICQIRNVLAGIPTVDNSTIIYTTVGDKAGFQFNGPISGLEPGDFSVVDASNSTFFMPFDGSGLTHLRQLSADGAEFVHPVDADLWQFTNQGIDASCVSQLDVWIATKWGDDWT
ncbi:MAG: hypothetical protein Q9169_007623 [Polycauliona sp. 2 TL-2023]